MRLARYVKFREEKFGGVLFETRSEKVFALNPTASAIVREIAGGSCDEPALITRLEERFSGSRGVIEREIAAFVGDLRGRGLLED
ncbi:MAG TPA: PqqD family protein [Steroidobacteraceae bacterium]|nr:PqqD family protein [Steroidobacteraceae bacterium]